MIVNATVRRRNMRADGGLGTRSDARRILARCGGRSNRRNLPGPQAGHSTRSRPQRTSALPVKPQPAQRSLEFSCSLRAYAAGAARLDAGAVVDSDSEFGAENSQMR
jgi:hypothetical protein